MLHILAQMLTFFNSKQAFSFIFCNVAKKSLQKISSICDYDRF